MSGSPKVSVITGAFNIKRSEADLAIKSIIDQSFTDFEFIVCEDGSSNDTWSILQRWAKKDSRIVLLQHKENQGLMISLNDCLTVAKGEYIARMDLDDYCFPDRLEKQVKALDTHDEYDIVTSNSVLFDDDHMRPYGERLVPERPMKQDMLFSSPFLHGGAMMRKSALDRVDGYRVAKETWRAEDYDLWMRMYAAGSLGYNIQEPLYAIREDKRAYSRRKYKYRLQEAIVRYKGFRALGLLPKGTPYIIKPLIVGVIPSRVLRWLKTK